MHAVPVEPGEYTCVLSPTVAGVFAHESFGHKSESDFMLGSETMRREWELGKQVGWDGKTKTVYIGEVPGQVTYLLDVCQPYESYEFHTPTTFTMAGKMYSNGFILACNPYWTEGEGYALFNLNGAYSTLEFDFGHEDGTDLEDGGNYYFYLDGKLVKTITPHPEDMVKHYKISLNNALQMKIVCDLHNSARYGFANAAIQ